MLVPLTPPPEWDWEWVKTFCRAFAELMSDEAPDRYLAHLKIADRRGRVLVDWLRNGMGNTGKSQPGSRSGRLRTRIPVASATALASAAAVGPCAASPVPRKGAPGRLITCTSTLSGTESKRRIG